MRTLGSDALQQEEGNDCFPGCMLYDANPHRFRRALRPLGIVFLTSCFAAYLSHTFQSDMKHSPEMNLRSADNEYRANNETDNKLDTKFKLMEKSALDLISSIKNIQDDLYGIKSVVKGGLNEEMVKQTEGIVNRQLQIYDADKTGITDYALENLGGCILSIRGTATYKEGTPTLTFFGIPVMTTVTDPHYIIQAKDTPGDCWAIKGSQGCAVIQLIADVVITAITIEHIPRALSPTGDISSAPKQVTLYGLTELDDDKPHKFGTFFYNKSGPSIQTFIVQEPAFRTFRIVEVKIESNHGHPKFTCVYRIRIHGRPPDIGLKRT